MMSLLISSPSDPILWRFNCISRFSGTLDSTRVHLPFFVMTDGWTSFSTRDPLYLFRVDSQDKGFGPP